MRNTIVGQRPVITRSIANDLPAQILHLLRQGLGQSEVCSELGISPMMFATNYPTGFEQDLCAV